MTRARPVATAEDGSGAAPEPEPAAPPRPVTQRLRLLALLITAGFLVLLVLGTQVRNEMRLLQRASQDNVQWNLSQLEVELLVFGLALADYRDAPDPAAALREIRRRFDVFYNRVGVLSRGETYRVLKSDRNAAQGLAELESFIDETVPLIDGPDDGLVAALDRLRNQVLGQRAAARRVANDGIGIFARRSFERREVLSSLLFRFSLILLVMLLALGAVLVILFRQFGIAEQESREKELSRARLSATVGASLDAVVVADGEGRIIDFNGAATQIFGYSRDEALGRKVSELIVPERLRSQHETGMRRYLEKGETSVVDAGLLQLSALRRDGTEFPVEASIATSRGPHGMIFVSFLRDISARVAAQKELTAARDRALAADRAKSNFIAVMSHEMRTPLNGIVGTLDLLEGSGLTPQQAGYLDVLRTSSNLLLRHVNDVLDLSRVQSNKMQLDDEPFAPAALVSEVVEITETMAAERGNRVAVDCAIPAATRLCGDPFRVKQVLLNILSNAVKFTRNGHIDIRLARVVDEGRGPMLEISVSDTGIGIEPKDLDRVFEDFVTLDATYARAAEGTGLGLGISRRIAEAMGGGIGVESTPGRGSRFWLRLPWSPAGPADGAAEELRGAGPPGQEAPLSVLVVEDNGINRAVARQLLEQLGHRVEEAHDGLEGVALARGQAFDLILMDISMPELDGVSATERIRAPGGASAETPIIGLTAHVLPEEQRRFRLAGMQMCLAKPVTARMLRDVTAHASALRRSARAGAGPGAGALAGLAGGGAPGGGAEAPLVDFEVLAGLADRAGDAAFHGWLTRFTDETEAGLAQLGGLCDDPQGLAHLAHRLAGSAAVFGAARLRLALLALEAESRAGDAAPRAARLDEARVCWPETRRELADLVEEA